MNTHINMNRQMRFVIRIMAIEALFPIVKRLEAVQSWDMVENVSLHSVCWALIESKKCVSEYYERQIGLDNQKKNTKKFYCLAEYLLSVEIGFFFTKKPLRRNRGSLHSLSFSIFWIPSVKIKTIILPSRCSCKAESANVSTVSL